MAEARDSSGQDNHGTLTNFPTPIPWQTDTANGTFDPTAKDETTNNNHGRLVGYASDGSDARSTDIPSGASGTSLQFDGTDDYVEINDVTSGSFFGGAHSFSCWVKLSDWSANRTAVGAGRTAATQPYSEMDFNLSDTKLYARTKAGSNENAVASSATYNNDSNWHHLVSVVNASGHIVGFYIDGVSQGSDSTFTNDLSAADKCYIGQLPWTSANVNAWPGDIDEVRLYSDALTADEVTYLYNNHTGGAGGTDPGTANLVGHWKFDESNTRSLSDIGSGLSLAFDGTDDYVNIGRKKIPPLLNGATGATISAWVNAATLDATLQVIVWIPIKASGITGLTVYVTATTDLVLAGGRSVNTDGFQSVSSDNAISAGEWYHVACVCDFSADTVSVYVNGVGKTSSATFANTTFTDAADQTDDDAIGEAPSGGSPAQYFDGNIDDIRIYNVAKTAAEIYALYTGTDDTTGLVGHWKLDDRPGLWPYHMDNQGLSGGLAMLGM